MSIYIIVSNYFENGAFGCYSTIKRARIALEAFLKDDNNILTFKDIGDYCYQILTKNDEEFIIEICHVIVDEEFERGYLNG